MAAAAILTDLPTAVTNTATPLNGPEIQGSTQKYDLTVNSPQSQAPVFFAPQHREKLNTYWGSMLQGVVRSFYAFASGETLASLVSSRNSFEWDRLNLELMRIVNLEPNWDGEGAERVPQKAATNAAILLFLAKVAMEQSTITQCSVPTVIPAVDGGVTLKWSQGNRELRCTVRSDIVEVVRWRSLDRYESDGFWENPVQRVAEHFEWLLQQ